MEIKFNTNSDSQTYKWLKEWADLISKNKNEIRTKKLKRILKNKKKISKSES